MSDTLWYIDLTEDKPELREGTISDEYVDGYKVSPGINGNSWQSVLLHSRFRTECLTKYVTYCRQQIARHNREIGTLTEQIKWARQQEQTDERKDI